MWSLSNQTPYGAARNWTRDKEGVHLWIVAVKATFTLDETGRIALADEQPPPPLAPEYFGEPGKSSLKLDSDLLAAKPCTDVIAIAAAHAARGGRSKMVPVRLRAGEIDKVLVVYGERAYARSLTGGVAPSEPAPFEQREIRYEHAFGGVDLQDTDPAQHRIDARNPVGMGFANNPTRLLNRPAPTVQYPDGDIAKLGPAGFGAIDQAWSPRRELAGTYDARWDRKRRPLLAEDYNELFASCAPADQRSERMRGGERVELQNLTPSGLLRFELPKIYLTFTSNFARERREHRSRLTTIVLEPEAMRFTLVWQSVLPVASPQTEHLDRTTIREKPYLT